MSKRVLELKVIFIGTLLAVIGLCLLVVSHIIGETGIKTSEIMRDFAITM